MKTFVSYFFSILILSSLPGEHQLRKKYMQRVYIQQSKMEAAALAEYQDLTLNMDGWSTVTNTSVYAINVVTPDGVVFLLDVLDLSSHKHDIPFITSKFFRGPGGSFEWLTSFSPYVSQAFCLSTSTGLVL